MRIFEVKWHCYREEQKKIGTLKLTKKVAKKKPNPKHLKFLKRQTQRCRRQDAKKALAKELIELI
jgi:hypothetical protein